MLRAMNSSLRGMVSTVATPRTTRTTVSALGCVAALGNSFMGLHVRWASKKAASSTTNNKNSSPGPRLGIKKIGSHYVRPGMIIAKQRGRTYWPGLGVGMGRDDTIYAMKEGRVIFTKICRPFRSRRRWRTFISVHDLETDGSEVWEWNHKNQADYLEKLAVKKSGLKRMTTRGALRIIASERFAIKVRDGLATGALDDYPGGWKELLREKPFTLPDKLPLLPPKKGFNKVLAERRKY